MPGDRSRCRSWLLLLLGSGAAGLSLANVIGDDGRHVATQEAADLVSAVGIVTCSRVVDGRTIRGWGTGTVVGSRRTVLTAAHVFASNPARWPTEVRFDPVADCVFRQYEGTAGRAEAVTIDRSRDEADAGAGTMGNADPDASRFAFRDEPTTEVRFARADFGRFRDNPGRPTEDWAVLRTAEPLPEATQPLSFAALGVDELTGRTRLPIMIVAFHADVREMRRVPLLSEGELFGVDYAGYRRLAHTADIGRMSSGAAIVHRTDNGRAIVIGLNRSSELFNVLRGYAYGDMSLPDVSLLAAR